ncbi:MAG: hypothetical protein AAGD38_12890 [Acidobacteriota bacterium]
MRRFRLLLTFLLVWLLTAPVFGYVIFLKSGQQIQAQEKYEVRGDLAIITLRSGTRSQIRLDEIDIEKTERVNAELNLDSASQLLEGVPDQTVIDPATIDRVELSDVIAARRQQAAVAPEIDASLPEDSDARRTDNLARTQAGFIDLSALPRIELEDLALGREIRASLEGQGVQDLAIYEGTTLTSPFLEVVANSEEAVFQALQATSSTLVQMQQAYPDQIEAFELLLLTTQRERSGQFFLNVERANSLLSGKEKPHTFFLKFVEF